MANIVYEKILGYVVCQYTSGEKMVTAYPIIAGLDGIIEPVKLDDNDHIIGVLPANDDYKVWWKKNNDGDLLGFEFGGKTSKQKWNAELKKAITSRNKQSAKLKSK